MTNPRAPGNAAPDTHLATHSGADVPAGGVHRVTHGVPEHMAACRIDLAPDVLATFEVTELLMDGRPLFPRLRRPLAASMFRAGSSARWFAFKPGSTLTLEVRNTGPVPAAFWASFSTVEGR